MSLFRALTKTTLFFTLVLLYFLTATPLFIFRKTQPYRMKKIVMILVKFYCEILLIVMRAKVVLTGNVELIKNKQNYLIVSNHMSYMDVLFINRYRPSSFVTSMEIKHTPFLGQLVILAGCVFVERRNKSNLSNEIAELTDSLNNGLDICIFPEATSTNGEELLRFRKPLFQSAIDSQKALLPLCLHYKKIDHMPVTTENRDFICWYDDMSFLPHFWSLMKQKSIEIEVQVLDTIKIQPNSTAEQLAYQSYETILKQHRPFQKPLA